MADYGAPSALQALLAEADRPGQIVRNLWKGRTAAAGRHALDFLTAPIPGVDATATDEDMVSGSDLAGIQEPGLKKIAADVVLGTLTDPLSLLTFGAGKGIGILGKTIAGAGKTLDPLTLAMQGGRAAIGKGAKLADDLLRPTTSTIRRTPAQDAVKLAGQSVRNALGWHDLTTSQRAILDAARGAGAVASKAGVEEAGRTLKGLSDAEQVALGDAIDGLRWVDGKAVGVLAGDTVEERLAIMAATQPGLRLPELRRAAQGVQRLSDTQWDEGVRRGVYKPGLAKQGYLQRQYDFGDRSSAIGARQHQSPDETLAFLEANPAAQYERHAGRRLVERAAQQGRLIERAHLGRSTVGPAFTLAEDTDRAAVQSTIATLAEKDPDFAHRMDQAFNGMAPRGAFTNALNTTNKLFKPAAVYGVVIPKVGSIVRNQIGMVWQALSAPGVSAGPVLKHAVSNLLQAFDDGWEHVTKGRVLGRTRLTQDLKQVEEAFARSGGSGEAVAGHLRSVGREDLALAVEHGVMDGFVSTEEIIKGAKREGWRGTATDLWNAPGAIFQGVEQRGRLATFLDLLHRDHGAPKAAQLTKDAFLDYSITGTGNRTLRDIVPFAQFLAQSVPQQARFLSRAPGAAVALAPLIGQHDDLPVYPYIADQAHIPLGLDEAGNPQYAVGTGLPVEQLGSIPDILQGPMAAGRSIKRHVVSALHPLIKTAERVISGEDPYFESPYGSYRKEPFTGKESALGGAYHSLAATGLIEPLASGTRQIEKAADSRHTVGSRALDLLTGTNVQSVDPDLAERRIVSDTLRQHPEVRRVESFYDTEGSPEVEALMERLKASKAALREKRKAAAAAIQ